MAEEIDNESQGDEIKTEETPADETPQSEEKSEDTDKERSREENEERGVIAERHKRQEAQRIARELEVEVAELKKQKPDVEDAPILDDNTQEGIEVLKSVVEKAVAPIREGLDAQNRELISEKFWTDPLNVAMAPEIKKEFKELPDNLPYTDRLKQARAFAISNNIEAFATAHQEIGQEKAYESQDTKNGQRPLPAGSARTGGEQKTAWERVKDGDIAPGSPEYMSHREEILKAEREEALS